MLGARRFEARNKSACTAMAASAAEPKQRQVANLPWVDATMTKNTAAPKAPLTAPFSTARASILLFMWLKTARMLV